MVCDVPEPEERFNIDEYSEMVILNKPVVYISIGELINTHKVWLFVNHLFYSFVYSIQYKNAILLSVQTVFVSWFVLSCCWSTRKHCVLIRMMLSFFC